VAGSASRDISDVAGILSDIKTAVTKVPDAADFEAAYQQYAELLAPVMLLSNGLNFEVKSSRHPVTHKSSLSAAPASASNAMSYCLLL
jgi:hypothetical protein